MSNFDIVLLAATMAIGSVFAWLIINNVGL
jgi:hypothetical protein